jgi:hypothetical protein
MNTPANRTVLRVAATAVFAAVVAMILSITYADKVGRDAVKRADENTRQSQQAWCAVIVTVDNAYVANPPTTETGKQIAAGMHSLRRSFGC